MQSPLILHLFHVLKYINMKLLTFLSVGAFIVLSAFVVGKKIDSTVREKTMTITSLYATKWFLKQIYTDNGSVVVTEAFIKFNREKKSAGGNGSCNMFGSNFSVNNDEISFKNIFSTKMYCEGAQQQEDLFFKQLEKVNRFEIKGEILKLYQDKDLLLEFESSSE